MRLEIFLSIALLALSGLLAVGAVLFIKITRRSQRASRHTVANVVEVRPISQTQVAKFKRRFALAAGLILTGLTGLGFWVAAQA